MLISYTDDYGKKKSVKMRTADETVNITWRQIEDHFYLPPYNGYEDGENESRHVPPVCP